MKKESSKKKSRKVLLLDGHSLAYRAFFALPDTIATTKGQVTNAVYGFVNMLLKVVADEEPDSVVATFDGPLRKTLRYKEYPEYKAGRPPMPDTLRSQIGLIKEILEAMGIPCICVEGYEADDLIGTLARRVEEEGSRALIITGDRDMLQLVDDSVTVLLNRKGISEMDKYDEDAVEEKYGVPPDKLVDIVSLKGDSSDNIPGVPGIGEKGARSLIQEFGTLENLLEHKEKVKNKRQKEALKDHQDQAILSKKLATIVKEVECELDLPKVSLGNWDTKRVLELFEELEFNTLATRFLRFAGEEAPGVSGAKALTREFKIESGERIKVWERLIKRCEKGGHLGIRVAISGEGFCDARVVKAAIAYEDRVILVPGYLFQGHEGDGEPFECLKMILEDENISKSLYQAKAAYLALKKIGILTRGVELDPEVAAYVLDPTRNSYPLQSLAAKFLGEDIVVSGEVAQQPTFEDAEVAIDDSTLVQEAASVYLLTRAIQGSLEREGLSKLYQEVEHPLMWVLAHMEENGVVVDSGKLEVLSNEAGEAIAKLEKGIYKEAGHDFNINSTKQLGKVLFEEMGIPPIKRIKTGYSTDASVLEELKSDHPIAGMIVSYRELTKLRSTYRNALPRLICARTGRVHCSFNQAATATGRLSSSNPNLQNIPVRTDFGKKIRDAFIPRHEDWEMLVADYSQIELRVLAHMSGDENLLDAFARGEDIHRDTASKIFSAKPSEVTAQERRVAKMVNFGVVYGMSSYGLSRRLGISTEDAAEFIHAYFKQYSQVAEYIEQCKKSGLERGYAETILGRRRNLPELKSRNRRIKELGERLAVNTPLQGSAADIIKLAMISIAREMEEKQCRSLMTLQVHDELVFEVAPGENKVMSELVARQMSGAYKLEVELKVDLSLGPNWGSAK